MKIAPWLVGCCKATFAPEHARWSTPSKLPPKAGEGLAATRSLFRTRRHRVDRARAIGDGWATLCQPAIDIDHVFKLLERALRGAVEVGIDGALVLQIEQARPI